MVLSFFVPASWVTHTSSHKKRHANFHINYITSLFCCLLLCRPYFSLYIYTHSRHSTERGRVMIILPIQQMQLAHSGSTYKLFTFPPFSLPRFHFFPCVSLVHIRPQIRFRILESLLQPPRLMQMTTNTRDKNHLFRNLERQQV